MDEARTKYVVWGGLALGGTLYVLHRVIRAGKNTQKGLPLPCPDPLHPILKHIPLMAERVGRRKEHFDAVVCDLMKEQPSIGKVFRMKLVALDIIVVCDADAAKEIMVQKNYPKSHTYSDLHPFIGEKSMVCSHGKTWAKQRKAFSPGFQFAFLKDLVPTFAEKTQLLLTKFNDLADTGVIISLHQELIKVAMDVICQVALSVNFGFMSKEPPEIYHLFMELLDQTAELARSPHLSWTRWLPWVAWHLRSVQARFDAHIIRVIKHRLEASAQGNAKNPAASRDILELALKTAMEDSAAEGEGKGLDLQDVLAQVKTFLFAGHDTTATTVSFTVYEISQHPDVEAKLLEEIDRVCGGKAPTSDDLGNLKYTGCVIKEALRMWPPGGTARIAPSGSTLRGFDISNTPIYIPHYPIHRSTDYFGPDAGVFRPERWQDEAYVAALNPNAYMPFSKGSRDCIGQTFALMEAKTLIAMLYSKYTFKYASRTPESQAFRITSYPKEGTPMTIHTRKKQ